MRCSNRWTPSVWGLDSLEVLPCDSLVKIEEVLGPVQLCVRPEPYPKSSGFVVLSFFLSDPKGSCYCVTDLCT